MRIGLKTITLVIPHFIVAFSVTFLLTGRWMPGGLIALTEPAVITIAYLIHENGWEKTGLRSKQNLLTSYPLAGGTNAPTI